MNKGFRDGFIVDNSILILDEKKTGIRIPARVIQFLVILIGSISAFAVLLQSISAPVNLYIPIFVSLCITFALCMIPRYDLVKLFFAILCYGLFFFSRLPQLKNGFYLLENLIIDKIFQSYQYSFYYFVADQSSITADLSLIMIMMMIPVVALFTIAVVRNRLTNLCSLILFLPVTASFLLGVIPSEKYLIAYMAVILYLVKSGLPYHNVKNKEQRILFHRINSRAAVWLSLLALMVFFILKLFIPERQYDNLTELNDMKSKVTQTFSSASLETISEKITDFKLFEFEAASGGLQGGILGNIGKVEYTGEDELVITAPYASTQSGIYLKGYVGSYYTGSRWAGHSKEDKEKIKLLLNTFPVSTFAPVNQTSQMLNLVLSNSKSVTESNANLFEQQKNYMIEGSLQVSYEGANKKFVYAPYYTDYSQLENISYEDDLYASSKSGKDKYDFRYYFNFELGDSDNNLLKGIQNTKYSDYEAAYRNYVYSVYTKLPGKGLTRLKKDFSKDNATINKLSLTQKLDYVKKYLDSDTKYTLAPGKLPKGKDFVEYFLYENKKGYCVHYASAGVLMLRAMGVPARYVEGYAVSVKPTTLDLSGPTQQGTFYSAGQKMNVSMAMDQVTVHDYNAHAWVEIYIDGCGWIPVEFTPGSVIQYNTAAITDFEEAGQYLDDQNDTQQPSITPQIPTMPANNMDKNQMDKQKNQMTKADPKEAAIQQAKVNTGFMICFVLLVTAAAGSFLIVLIRKYRRIRNETNRNKKAIYLYMEIEKLLKLCTEFPRKRAKIEDCEDFISENISYVNKEQFTAFMDTVRKARFGKGSISELELRSVEEFRHGLYQKIYEELPTYQKLRIKIGLLI